MKLSQLFSQLLIVGLASSFAAAQQLPPGIRPLNPPTVLPLPTRQLPPMPTSPPPISSNRGDLGRNFPNPTSNSASEPELKYFSCGFSDATVRNVLQNCPKEMAKLKAEGIDRPVSVTCFQKYPEVVEYEIVFESCKSCPVKIGNLWVTENRRSTYGGPATYSAYLSIE